MLASVVKKISNLTWTNLTSGEPAVTKKIVRSNKVVVALLRNGSLWSNVVDAKYFYPIGRDHYTDDVLRCLVLLGLITQKMYERHMQEYETQREKMYLQSDADLLARLLETHGTIEAFHAKLEAVKFRQKAILAEDDAEAATIPDPPSSPKEE